MTSSDPSHPLWHEALLSASSRAQTPLLVPWNQTQGFEPPGRRKQSPSAVSPPAPSAPSSVKFSELTTTSVNVSWEAPQFPNGVLEGYRLVYEPCTPVDGEWGPPSRGAPQTHPLHRSRP